MTDKRCIATVTTDDYLPGTVVTLASFLAQHPGFDGDVVVIHDGLSERGAAVLSALAPDLRLLPVSPGLKQHLHRLGEAHPRFRPTLMHWHILEAYLLTEYAKVLLVDGDLLFRQPIDELFAAEGALLCCPDWVFLAGRCRDAATFKPLPEGETGSADRPALDRTFNDGMMLLDRAALGAEAQADLLALLVPETWNHTDTPHTKQLIHNMHFAGRHRLVSSTYNYILTAGNTIAQREGLEAKDAKVLHYNLPVKPWMPGFMLDWLRGDRPVPAFAWWYDAWMQCLAAGHLRNASRNMVARTIVAFKSESEAQPR